MPLYTPHGFLLPELLDNDDALYGRWDYLTVAAMNRKLPKKPLPQIEFLTEPHKLTAYMLGVCLDAIPNRRHNGWHDWHDATYFDYFLQWLLHALHHDGHMEVPKEPANCRGASKRLADRLDLALWQGNPYDYLGDMLAATAYGKRLRFTPLPVDRPEQAVAGLVREGANIRKRVFCDPSAGTGRALLQASNASLRLYGQETDPLLCRATLVNGYLFAPWLVQPLTFLAGEENRAATSRALSDTITAQAPPSVAVKLAETVYDAKEQWRFAPIIKRTSIDLIPPPVVWRLDVLNI